MTTFQVREKLGKLVNGVFTKSFSEKYTMIASQILDVSIASTVAMHSDSADAYITLASKHIDDPKMLENLALCANPLVVFVVFARYHSMTQRFGTVDQKMNWSFPDESSSFLVAVLVDEWHASHSD